jgi:hypothetical protein
MIFMDSPHHRTLSGRVRDITPSSELLASLFFASIGISKIWLLSQGSHSGREDQPHGVGIVTLTLGNVPHRQVLSFPEATEPWNSDLSN